MARTIIDLPPSQMRDLDALCASLGISRAEAVRRAVQAFLLKSSEGDARCFGMWSSDDGDEPHARDEGPR